MRKEVRIEGKPRAPPDKVSVSSLVREYYLEFLNAIPLKSSDKDERFKNALQCIVWGFCYVEALTNRSCELTILKCCRSPESAEDYWSRFERRRSSRRPEIDRKIQFLASVHQVDEAALKRIKQTVTRLRQMRNRLVHGNEKPTVVGPKDLDRPMTEGAGIREILEALPDPKIVEDVMKIDAEQCRKDVLQVGVWLEAFLRDLGEDPGVASNCKEIQRRFRGLYGH